LAPASSLAGAFCFFREVFGSEMPFVAEAAGLTKTSFWFGDDKKTGFRRAVGSETRTNEAKPAVPEQEAAAAGRKVTTPFSKVTAAFCK
jgi:hypothetical protein